MEPQQQTIDKQKIISIMKITKKTDPLFKPLKKLKNAIDSIGVDKLSYTPKNRLIIFHFGLGNDLDNKILQKTCPHNYQNQQPLLNLIIPGKSYCILQFPSSSHTQNYLLSNKYHKILQQYPIFYIEIKYENLSRIIIAMYASDTFVTNNNKQLYDIQNCEEKYGNQIPGLYVFEEFITEEEEGKLFGKIDQGEWERLNNRRVQHYGYQFKYGRNQVDKEEEYQNRMPQFIEGVMKKIQALQIVPKQYLPFDQMTINDYFPGDGIPSHFDTHSPFEQYFIAISLLSGITMQFRKYDGTQQNIYLHERSLIIFSGEGRYAWTHGISCRKVDKVNQLLKYRARRISITLRKIRKQPCICPYYFYCDSQGYDQKTMKKNNPLLKKYISQQNYDKLKLAPELIYKKYVEQAYNGFGYNFHNKVIPTIKQYFTNIVQNNNIIINILDVGCGNGQYYQQLFKQKQHLINYIGIQYCQIMCECENKVYMDGRNMLFRDDRFDVVLCVAVLHHFTCREDRIRVLGQIRRVMCKGGYGYITCFCYESKKEIYGSQDIILQYCVPTHKIRNIQQQQQQHNKQANIQKNSKQYKQYKQQQNTNKQYNNNNNKIIYKQECRKQKKGEIYQRYYHLFTQEEIIGLIEQCGLQIIEIKKDVENYIVKVCK